MIRDRAKERAVNLRERAANPRVAWDCMCAEAIAEQLEKIAGLRTEQEAAAELERIKGIVEAPIQSGFGFLAQLDLQKYVLPLLEPPHDER